MKYKILVILLAIVPIFTHAERNLEEEEVARLIKPSIVRIVQHVSGEATIPFFDIDTENLSLSYDSDQEPWIIPFDEYITGSGSIINPNGYILTNSHVVSNEAIKTDLVNELLDPAFTYVFSEISEERLNEMLSNGEISSNLVLNLQKELIEKSKFKIEKQIVVLDPKSKSQTSMDIFNEGFQAAVISVNDNYYMDDKDAALIKIDKDNLPAVRASEDLNVNIGEAVYLFGYPTSATFNDADVLEPTFTKGTINSIKKAGDFDIIQTDAKSSLGSSGSPTLNTKGDFIGLLAFGSDMELSNGDNFGFTIPIGVVKKVIEANYVNGGEVEFQEGNYGVHFRKGLDLMHDKHCKNAISEFQLALNSNENFDVEKFVTPYIKSCNDMILSGKSIDTPWDEFWQQINSTSKYVWGIVGIIILVISLLVLIVIWLIVRLREEDRELDELEDIVKENREGLNKMKMDNNDSTSQDNVNKDNESQN